VKLNTSVFRALTQMDSECQNSFRVTSVRTPATSLCLSLFTTQAELETPNIWQICKMWN